MDEITAGLSLPDSLMLDDTTVSDIQAVILDESSLALLAADSRIEVVVQTYPEGVPEEEGLSTSSRSIMSDTSFEPDVHHINIYSQGSKRIFEWNGSWSTQSRLDRLHKGPSTAFEPDIKLCFSTFLGLPTKGWVRPGPRVNNHYWASNMPHAYIDTQASDGNKRTYCVETTAAEMMLLDQTYYFVIKSPSWNSNKSKHREMAYDLQHWEKSGNNEGDPWSAGTITGRDTKVGVTFASLGDQHVPYARTY